ncbi:Uncharacterized protein C31F10.16 [Grifola frondosa]|uniref:Uncharacterized protein C31F10.16 n=1 Tax=Grifola frondosa TaxID=5627 RepID=A0A1C7LYB2_GRIFR|nr:Uncharacterized protein C31F10.16 [Grifola frondosa]
MVCFSKSSQLPYSRGSRQQRMVDASFKDVLELFETDLGESLTPRTGSLSTFRELGPPDFCHVVKSTGRSGQRDVSHSPRLAVCIVIPELLQLGSYHYVCGVDVSSSASLAVYIDFLTYAIEDDSGWFTKGTEWMYWRVLKSWDALRRAHYLKQLFQCFLSSGCARGRQNVRRHECIRGRSTPEKVHFYFLVCAALVSTTPSDVKQRKRFGRKHFCPLYCALSSTPTTLSTVLRLIAFDLITNPEGELCFLQVAEAVVSLRMNDALTMMPKVSKSLRPRIQVATVVSNHLTNAILKYFSDSGQYQYAANLSEKLSAKDPVVSSLLTKSHLGMNEEVKAVQITSAAMKQTPQSYTLLYVQCDFVRSKGNNEWALKLARQAVNCAPSEFVTWEKLTEIYIDLGQDESALLTVNPCPMFTYNGRDAHRNLNPARVHLPAKGMIIDILSARSKAEDDEADPALLCLPTPSLRGTWARAYALLMRFVSQIGLGMDFLKTAELRVRHGRRDTACRRCRMISTVVRLAPPIPASTWPQSPLRHNGARHCPGQRRRRTAVRTTMHRRVAWPLPPGSNVDDADIAEDANNADEMGGDSDSDTLAIANGIPTIRISTESDHEGGEEKANG